MKNVTDDFKTDIRTYGRQLDFAIKVNNEYVDMDDFNYLKPSFHIDLFKTAMHGVEIDSDNELAKKTTINIEAGVKLNEPVYEYINYNTYTVTGCERQEDTSSYIIKAYDKMIESMIDYDLDITEKMTIRQYLVRVCQRLGWNTKNIPTTFINSEKMIDPTLHIGIGSTFRDVLDEIATITCSFLLFIEDEFCMIYPIDTNENIDESYLDEDNIIIGEKYFINSLVFSRAEESDNIYRKDDKSIEENGLHEYRISDNQLLSTNDRDLYIDEMFDYLKTFEFYPFDIKTKGILFIEPCDRFNLTLGDKTYPTILLNDETTFEDGLTEDIYSDEPTETETDYKCADTTDKRLNMTYILVDKQNQKITQHANQLTEHEEKITEIEQDVDSIKQSVSNTIDYKRRQCNKNQLKLTDCQETNLMRFNMCGSKEYNNYLFPHNELYPGEIYPNEEVL